MNKIFFNLEMITKIEKELIKLSKRKFTGIELQRLKLIVRNGMFQEEWTDLIKISEEKGKDSGEYNYYLNLHLRRWGISGVVGYLKKVDPGEHSDFFSYTFEIDINRSEQSIKDFLNDVLLKDIVERRGFKSRVRDELGEGFLININYPSIKIPYDDKYPEKPLKKYAKKDSLVAEKRYKDILQVWNLRQPQCNGKPNSWTKIAEIMGMPKEKIRRLYDRDFEDIQNKGIPGYKPFPQDCLRHEPIKANKKGR